MGAPKYSQVGTKTGTNSCASDLGWYQPSPEGASHPDEILSQFAKVSAILEAAFENGDRELFDAALKTADQIIVHAVWLLKGRP